MDNEAHPNMNALFELPECDGVNDAGNLVWALDSAVPIFIEADLFFGGGSDPGAVRIHKFNRDSEACDIDEVEALGLARTVRSVRNLPR
ncbi:hypothetical protein [Rhodococcus sp. 008]|uniref:hypothetical protein n=1 Tax=Rhodococcus sp. 008 TaxID=1723645 RepID=UPI000806438A|nr:hypothetical protein [Rhodococcus sp. 008]ANQ74409.1 hypothetical protein AOT96_29025 [Rhodococcus sp. 008]